jgi:hypothetical protein
MPRDVSALIASLPVVRLQSHPRRASDLLLFPRYPLVVLIYITVIALAAGA